MSVLRTLLLSLVLAGAGGAVLAAATDGFRAVTTEGARRLDIQRSPRQVPAIALETQSGRRVDFSAFRGRWLLVDFIYARCVTYCSALGGEFAQLQARLEAPLAQGRLQLLSASFDPAHDGPSELAGYLSRHRDRGVGWIAVRPVTSQGLEQLKRVFGLTVVPDGVGGYVHNASIALVDPQGRLVDVYEPGDWSRIERDVRRNTQ